MAEISATETEGCQPIVIAGGYEDGLSGNKRTAEQSSDQTLSKANAAIANNFHAEFDAENGGMRLGTTGRRGGRTEVCEEKARERNLSTDLLQLMATGCISFLF